MAVTVTVRLERSAPTRTEALATPFASVTKLPGTSTALLSTENVTLMPGTALRKVSTAVTTTSTGSLPALPTVFLLKVMVRSLALGTMDTASMTSKLMVRTTVPLVACTVMARLVLPLLVTKLISAANTPEVTSVAVLLKALTMEPPATGSIRARETGEPPMALLKASTEVTLSLAT
ncbi:MAG: hypothetical protein CFE41_00735 [Burkholderiales bacterium PBB2]|nr:MAG: hypothetical protein CFE41_00735 [Burkholderiales bacterium PBB2]